MTSKRDLAKAARKGDAEAQVQLASMYWKGEGVTQDDVEARRLYGLAAAQGQAGAQCMLGTMLMSGIGGKVDFQEAVLMFGPPMTITWKMRPDTTTVLSARAPLIIYTENDATILPPDDSQGKAFYLDPPGQQGYCRDLFREHARQLTKELLHSGFPLSAKLERLADSSASE